MPKLALARVPPLYIRCRARQRRLPKSRFAKYKDNAIGARLLGFLLQDFRQHQQHSFGLIPYKNLVNAISSCLHIEGIVIGSEEEARAQHEAIYTLGLFYRNHLLRVFSQHPSRTSMERIIEEMETPSTKSDIRKHALLRDGYRCTLTGIYDFDSCKNHPELEARRVAANTTKSNIQCAHIFSESAQDGEKTDYAANATAILKMFGLSDAGEHLVGGNVNKHFNVFTMVDNLHHLYNHLEFWLEEVIGVARNFNFLIISIATTSPPRRRVTFKVDPDVEAACRAKNKPIPALPSPSLLAIRAACSRVGSPPKLFQNESEAIRDKLTNSR
ncbi:hypothetical protein B0H13DRAFT_2416453 [Mycena leptocephala]|nr:hypothetical protein B0H13DRAFT_2416453 [Mycena leptocephala]